MGKYFKKFNNHNDYEEFINIYNKKLNVSLCLIDNDKHVHYNKRTIWLFGNKFPAILT